MPSISMVELRRDAEGVLRRLKRGENLVLTYRGAPVVRLSPYGSEIPSEDDPFYKLIDHATGDGESLTNDEIDKIIYGA